MMNLEVVEVALLQKVAEVKAAELGWRRWRRG
jgi:hypothetical protein